MGQDTTQEHQRLLEEVEELRAENTQLHNIAFEHQGCQHLRERDNAELIAQRDEARAALDRMTAEPTKDQLDEVLRSAMFAADQAVIGKHFSCEADKTRAAVKAAFQLALANKLIAITPADEWPEYIVLVPGGERPEWLK